MDLPLKTHSWKRNSCYFCIGKLHRVLLYIYIYIYMKRDFSSIAHQVLKQQNYNKLPGDGRSHKKTKHLGCR